MTVNVVSENCSCFLIHVGLRLSGDGAGDIGFNCRDRYRSERRRDTGRERYSRYTLRRAASIRPNRRKRDCIHSPTCLRGRTKSRSSHPGFKKLVRSGIEIRIATRTDLDLGLQVGDVQQQVEVTAEAPLLETTKSERGQNISQEVLYSLPIYGGGLRSAEAFIGYMPGVNSGPEMSVNGSNGRARDILIDGASITIPESGGTNFYFPGFEAYQEMKLVTSTFNAEYGRLGGGLEIITTKSGTNSIHGSGFWNLRRDIFEAAGWSSNQVVGRTPGFRSKVRLNEEGGTAGGPIWIPKVYNGRNKSFFYFSYAKDIRPATPIITGGETVPTLLMKQWRFQPACRTGSSTRASTQFVNGVITRTAFPGNIIPKTRWSAISTKIVPVIPDPNSRRRSHCQLHAGGRQHSRRYAVDPEVGPLLHAE